VAKPLPLDTGHADRRPDRLRATERQKSCYFLIKLESFGAPRITKDGVTVAKEIELEDKFENMGAQMVEVGDRQGRRQVGCGLA
jgi:hypothetical protein